MGPQVRILPPPPNIKGEIMGQLLDRFQKTSRDDIRKMRSSGASWTEIMELTRKLCSEGGPDYTLLVQEMEEEYCDTH